MKKGYIFNIIKNNAFDLLNHNFNKDKKHFNNYKPSKIIIYYDMFTKNEIESIKNINFDFYNNNIILIDNNNIEYIINNDFQINYKIDFHIMRNTYHFYINN